MTTWKLGDKISNTKPFITYGRAPRRGTDPMLKVTTSITGRIERLTSHDGRIQYLPIGNDRILIDGRDCWRGAYCDATTGYVTAERVDAALWALACRLMAAVDGHNQAVSEAAREADFARQDARAEREAEMLANLRGFEEDL